MNAEFEFEIGTTPPVDDLQFEKFWTVFSEETASNRAEKSTERASFRDEVFTTYKAAFEAMELLHETAGEAINWASDTVHDALEDNTDDNAFAEYINLLVGLSGRAMLAFDEVAWLLRGGFPRGAMTRVRSLHELFVVAVTLAVYGSADGNHPDLVERYLAHYDVFTRKFADDLLAVENEGMDSTLNDEVMQALTQKRKALVAKYGRQFSQSWGWAAPLFPSSSPSFTGLSKLVLPTFNAFYGIASAEVHASSQGLIEAAREAENGDTYYLAGPQKDGLEVPAILGSGFLIGILGTVVPTSISFPDCNVPNKDGYYFMSALVRIQEQIRDGIDPSARTGAH